LPLQQFYLPLLQGQHYSLNLETKNERKSRTY
jgi:hypothetical protein